MNLKFKFKKQITRDIYSFFFEMPEGFSFTPGQFMHYKIPHKNPDKKGINRFFSISSHPNEQLIAISTRITSRKSSFKKTLFNLQAGDFIEANGPKGEFVFTEDKNHPVFIAGGIGITPFRSIIRDMHFQKKLINASLIYINRGIAFPFKEELEEIQKNDSTFTIHFLKSRPDNISLFSKIQNPKSAIFYISGPEKMVWGIKEMLNKGGIKNKNIKTDSFTGYD